jgi:hypothetical protein
MIEMSPPIAIMIDSIIHGSIMNLLRCNRDTLPIVGHTHLWNEIKIPQKALIIL